jgi:adenylate cyclase
MPIEIEKKFLVKDNSFLQQARGQYRISQGYLSSLPERTVRIRLKGDQGFLTIKGAPESLGMSRYEWEKEIHPDEATELLRLCERGLIEKTRYLVPFGEHVFEVDVFHGENDGLIVAEIELGHEDQSFEIPHWLGEEVTGQKRYYNSMLMKFPFSGWEK